jgi:hypothetical protein
MAAVGKAIIPQVIADLDFYHVNSSTDLNYRLRTLQRVAAAAIGAYLFYRYHPLLTAQISHIPYAAHVVTTVCFLIGYTLCAPASFLVSGGANIYGGGVIALSGIQHKNIGSIAIGIFMVLGGYILCQEYRKYEFCFYPSPDPLDKLVVLVANRNASRLWLRFYQ